MAVNIQTSDASPLNGFTNGNGEQNLAVWCVGPLIGTTQVLTLSATAQASSALSTANGDPVQVRVIGSNPFYIAVGANPTATSASMYVGSAAREIISVPSGQKVSVLQGSGGGNVWVTVLS